MAPDWSRKLPVPIVFGRRKLRTLADVRAFLLALPPNRQDERRAHYLAELALAAAKGTGDIAAIAVAFKIAQLPPARRATMSETMTGLVVAQDPVHADEWRVEYFDADGGCYVTIFSGPEAEQRARGYHAILQWLPTAEGFDALRRYIHELETARDPSGDLRELFRLREENGMLRQEVARLAGGDGGQSTRGKPKIMIKETTTTPGIMRGYPRYGGLMQFSPLTADEQKYDDTCHEIDKLEGQIGALSMLLFTAAEFMWFSHHVNKMHIFPKQPQLDRQLSDLRALLATLESRRS